MASAAEIALGAGPVAAARDRSTAEVDELARRATFARLVRQEAPIALGVARRLLGGAGGAEDLVQEACLRAWRHMDRLAPEAPLRPWFYRILINAGRDRLRRRKVRRREPPTPLRPRSDPVHAAAGRDLLVRIQAAVECLPLRQRECLLLRTQAQLSGRDVAELLAITEGAVKGHMVHARRSLLHQFGPELGEWGLTR